MSEAETDKPSKLKFEVRWGVSADGQPTIELPEGLPPGWYDPGSVEVNGETMVNAARRARDMAEVHRWLTDAGVAADQIRALLMTLDKAKNSDELRAALRPLLGHL